MKKKSSRKETGFFVKTAIFAFAVFAVITIVQLQLKYNQYEARRDQLRAEINNLEDKVEELENQANNEVDRQYIIDIAKEKLNLRLPEEIIFYNDLFN